jgi:hypothetical protein
LIPFGIDISVELLFSWLQASSYNTETISKSGFRSKIVPRKTDIHMKSWAECWQKIELAFNELDSLITPPPRSST